MARGRGGLLAAALAAAILGAAPSGAAAHRYADADSTDVTGTCTEDAPCRLDHAIEGAAADEVVILDDDTYVVDYRINPAVPVHVQGQPDEGRPKLVGSWNALDSAPAVLELLNGGSLRHLKIESHDLMQHAVVISGATAEDLIIRSKGDEAVNLLGGATGTLLRDTVVSSTYTGMAAIGIDDGPSGVEGVDLRNVTAVATGVGAVGIDSRVVQSDVTMVNVIARGGMAANDIQGQDPKLGVGHSNFRAEQSFGWSDLGGNQSDDPLFVDAGGFDFRTFADSPVVDAGIVDSLTGTTDPDGLPRDLGGAPDIGAYEKPVARPADEVEPPKEEPLPLPLPPLPADEAKPELGVSVVGGVASGQISFKPAGSSEFVPLTGAASIPVGALVDARRGAVRLTTARGAQGSSQVGVFSGAMFRVRQARTPNAYTVLSLAGGSFESCARTAAGRGAVVASGRRARSVRRLWARSRGGRFRTRGRHGTATVRGTVWSTADRCDGTMVRVRRGRVLVRDFGRRRPVLVTAGERYLARR
ncbi:MAG TPA: choice-of-anchor Q domain-containing protein [Thermoleophilaceae bacterium]|nr:choice-of-anchor Q domain-containing protein [Thermoleophilaceae bacterium]